MNEQHHHILVVDDDARLRDLLTRYLGEQGFEVKAAADGQQMDKLRAREHYHLIVLDLMMPGEDGLSICRRLRDEMREQRGLPEHHDFRGGGRGGGRRD